MRARWLGGLVAIVYVASLSASCSGRVQNTPTDAGTLIKNPIDASTAIDASPTPPPPTTGTGPDDCGDPVPSNWIPTFVGPNTALGLGSCSTADIAAFSSSTSSKTSTPNDWYTAISPTCQQCLFSGENDTTWQIIVLSPDLKTGLAAGAEAEGFLNVGPCFQEGPGGTGACAKGAFDLDMCIEAACESGCPSSCNSFAESKNGPCYSELQEQTTGCGASLQTLTAYCGDFTGDESTLATLANAVCGSGGDAGVSADGG
jgi:hypothetical protein